MLIFRILAAILLLLPAYAYGQDLINEPDLVAWYDGKDYKTMYDATSGGALVAIDGTIARWENKVSLSHHATQSTAGSRPLRKDGFVQFDGSDDFFIADSLGTALAGTNTPYSIYIVRRQDDIVNNKTSFTVSSNASVNQHFYDYTITANNRVEWFSRGDAGAPTASTIHFGAPLINSDQILSVVYGATGTAAFKMGTAISSSATLRGATTTNIATIGAYRRSDAMAGSLFWNGRIYGILVFNQAHTPADRRRIEAALSDYYQVGTLYVRRFRQWGVNDSDSRSKWSE